MSFLTPLLLLATISAAVPIYLHLRRQRNATRVEFSAVQFLFEQSTVKRRIRSWKEMLLLAVRILLCLAIPFLFARPFFMVTAQSQPGGIEYATAIVIDNSLASGFQSDSTPLLRRIQEKALEVIEDVGPDTLIGVFPTAQLSPHSGELTADHERLIREVNGLSVSPTPTQFEQAVGAALLALSNTSRSHKQLVVISSFPIASEFTPATSLPVSIRPIYVGEKNMRNIALTHVEVVSTAGQTATPVAIDMQITNYSDTQTETQVHLRINEQHIATDSLSLEANSSSSHTFQTTVGVNDATHYEISVDDHFLALDNKKYVYARPQSQLRILAINGSPATNFRSDELYYFRLATDSPSFNMTELLPEEVTSEHLQNTDIIVLANVGPLPSAVAKQMTAAVAKGVGLLITGGTNVNPDQLNKQLGTILPSPIQTFRTLQNGSILNWDTTHPLMQPFGKELQGLQSTRIHRHLLFTPSLDDNKHVLMQLDDGAPLLSLSKKHPVAVLATSIDRDDSNLSIQPGFLPLVHQLLRHLAGGQRISSKQNQYVGATFTLPFQKNERLLIVESPDGQTFPLKREEDEPVAHFSKSDVPGFYHVFSTAGTEERTHRHDACFAVSVDTRTSNLTPFDYTLLSHESSEKTATAIKNHSKQKPLWPFFSLAILLFLALESFLVTKPSSP